MYIYINIYMCIYICILSGLARTTVDQLALPPNQVTNSIEEAGKTNHPKAVTHLFQVMTPPLPGEGGRACKITMT